MQIYAAVQGWSEDGPPIPMEREPRNRRPAGRLREVFVQKRKEILCGYRIFLYIIGAGKVEFPILG